MIYIKTMKSNEPYIVLCQLFVKILSKAFLKITRSSFFPVFRNINLD